MLKIDEPILSRRQAVTLGAGSALALTLAACGGSDESAETATSETDDSSTGAQGDDSAASDFKAGFICLHDENSTYDLNFINGAKEACETLGIPEENYFIMTGIDEGEACYDAAAELVDKGCSYVFADSFGHEDFMIEAAKEFPEVQFAHATGTKAHTEGLDNYHNAFAAIYDGRYLAGMAAGMKLNELIEKGDIKEDEAKMGYVGAYTYAEVVSGYSSFYLGAKSVCPTVTMDVTFTGSWYDETAEKEAANKLIDGGCVLISQHADSMGAPTACETAGVPDVSYNGSTVDACPNTFIVSSRIDWAPYFVYSIGATMEGEAFDTDWCGDLSTGSVSLTDVNEKVAAEGTADAIDAALHELVDGTRHAYDTSLFTIDGKEVTTFRPQEATDPTFDESIELVYDGYLHESEYRSAPYFDATIHGINLLDTSF